MNYEGEPLNSCYARVMSVFGMDGLNQTQPTLPLRPPDLGFRTMKRDTKRPKTQKDPEVVRTMGPKRSVSFLNINI